MITVKKRVTFSDEKETKGSALYFPITYKYTYGSILPEHIRDRIIKHTSKLFEEFKPTLSFKYPAYIEVTKLFFDGASLFPPKLSELCLNPHADAMKIVRNYLYCANWANLSKNPGAIDLLRDNMNMIDPNTVSENTSKDSRLFDIWESLLGRLNWQKLSANPSAVPFLKKYCHFIDKKGLLANPMIRELLSFVPKDFISLNEMTEEDWSIISVNPSLVRLLLKNRDKINIDNLCKNTNAVSLVSDVINSVTNWGSFAENPGFIDLIEDMIRHGANYDMKWYDLCNNPLAYDLLAENLYKIENLLWGMSTPNGDLFIKRVYELLGIATDIEPSLLLRDWYLLLRDSKIC